MTTANLRPMVLEAVTSILTPEFLAALPSTQASLDNLVSSMRPKKREKKMDEMTGSLF